MCEHITEAIDGSPLVETGPLLSQAGVQLALVEVGARGDIASMLRGTAQGAAVVTVAHLLDGPVALATQLGLSLAKLEAFGWLSPMVAAEAATALIDTYEGGWGLAVLTPQGNRTGDDDVPGENAYVALGTPSTTVVEPCLPADVTRVALTLLRCEAQRRLTAKSGEENLSHD